MTTSEHAAPGEMTLARFFEAHPEMNSLISCEIGPGWHAPVLEALQRLAVLQQACGLDIRVLQIKEKFARLCLYFVVGDDQLRQVAPELVERVHQQAWRIVRAAEDATSQLCERCGAAATETVRLRGYMCRRCERCIAELVADGGLAGLPDGGQS